MLLGSEGTLGIITEVTLRLIPQPEATVVLIIPFNNLAAISEMVVKIFEAKIVPTMLELMDKKTVSICEKFLNRELPFNTAQGHLLIRLDGRNRGELEESYQTIGDICLGGGGIDVLVADSVSEHQITNLIMGVQEISRKYSLPVANFGHLGDGNIHVNFLREDLEEGFALEALAPALNELFRLAVSLGGKISGEHGIGLLKKPYFHLSVDKNYLELLRNLKNLFDPHHILNPGKIFDFFP